MENPAIGVSRRIVLTAAGGLCGLAAPSSLSAKTSVPGEPRQPRSPAKSCIILFCWGGISHHESFDTKPGAPAEIRGEFEPIASSVPGIELSEHLPLLARQTHRLAIIRSIHHDDAEHGRGMYWNLTGHKAPGVGKIPPTRGDWPSLSAMISKFRVPREGIPGAVRLPYAMVDSIVQAGESAGWLGSEYDPILIRTPAGEPFGGISRTNGAEVLNLSDIDGLRTAARSRLLRTLERERNPLADEKPFGHFRDLAQDILLGSKFRDAYDLEQEDPRIRATYGGHLGGQSMLLARRLTEAGVPVVQVCCAAGDLNGGDGDMWDTHRDNFNRLKRRLLPVFDRGVSALLEDLADRGTLDETLVAILTDFGRTPRINASAGRDHYPNVYSVALAGGGIRGGQVYGSSDANGAFPASHPCTPPDIHATIFQALGISPHAEIRDMLGRPFRLSEGEALPLF